MTRHYGVEQKSCTEGDLGGNVAKMLESKVSAEGRVSIPADIRNRLGLQPGDRVQFVLNEDGVDESLASLFPDA